VTVVLNFARDHQCVENRIIAKRRTKLPSPKRDSRISAANWIFLLLFMAEEVF